MRGDVVLEAGTQDDQIFELRRSSERKSIAATARDSGDDTPDETELSASVVIPTLNERENITAIVDGCLRALAAFESEIIIVDDDSPDRTWEVAANEYDGDSRVRILWRTATPDLATAILAGFRAASHDYCAVIDADLQHPPEKLTVLIEALTEGADIAIGSRYADGGAVDDWSPLRRIVSVGATNAAKVCIPAARSLTDPMSGFFAVRRPIIVDAALDPEGYKLLLEILAACEYDTVVEVPYVFQKRERGKSNLTLKESLKFVRHTLSLGFPRVKTPLPDRSRPPSAALAPKHDADAASQVTAQPQESPRGDE